VKPRIFRTLDGLKSFLSARRGHAHHLAILHDEGCNPYACRCRPWYRVADLTTETVIKGERAQNAFLADLPKSLN
jgi:hypothetical protein